MICCRLLLGLHPSLEKLHFYMLGIRFDYEEAILSKSFEGFLEAGPQLLLQTYIQFQTGWPTLQPLIGSVQSIQKGIYFPNQLPGKLQMQRFFK